MSDVVVVLRRSSSSSSELALLWSHHTVPPGRCCSMVTHRRREGHQTHLTVVPEGQLSAHRPVRFWLKRLCRTRNAFVCVSWEWFLIMRRDMGKKTYEGMCVYKLLRLDLPASIMTQKISLKISKVGNKTVFCGDRGAEPAP